MEVLSVASEAQDRPRKDLSPRDDDHLSVEKRFRAQHLRRFMPRDSTTTPSITTGRARSTSTASAGHAHGVMTA